MLMLFRLISAPSATAWALILSDSPVARSASIFSPVPAVEAKVPTSTVCRASFCRSRMPLFIVKSTPARSAAPFSETPSAKVTFSEVTEAALEILLLKATVPLSSPVTVIA